MTDAYILLITREALYLVLLVSAPPVLAAAVVGGAAGVLQAATGVRDGSIAFVPKMLATLLALAVTAPWIMRQIVRFAGALMSGIPHVTG